MREKVYVLKCVDFINTSLSAYVNTQNNEANLIADAIDLLVDEKIKINRRDFEDEDGDINEEVYERAVEYFKNNLTTQEIIDCIDACDDCFYENLIRELSELELFDDANSNKRKKEIKKLLKDRPSPYVILKERDMLKCSESGFLKHANGYTYLYVSEY